MGCYRIINTFGIKFDSDKDTDDPGIGIEVLNPDELKANGWGYWIENDDEVSLQNWVKCGCRKGLILNLYAHTDIPQGYQFLGDSQWSTTCPHVSTDDLPTEVYSQCVLFRLLLSK